MSDSGGVLVTFRRGVPADLPGLLELERAAHTYPWPEAILDDILGAPKVICTVMEDEHKHPLGFAVVQAVADEASLLNLVIAPASQGRGLGRRLLNHVIDCLLVDKVVETLFLEVRVSNFSAIALYLSCGFVEVGERRDYYPAQQGSRENALMMALPLAAAY